MPRVTGDFIIAELDVFEPSRIQNAFTHISKTATGWIDHFNDLPEDCKTAQGRSVPVPSPRLSQHRNDRGKRPRLNRAEPFKTEAFIERDVRPITGFKISKFAVGIASLKCTPHQFRWENAEGIQNDGDPLRSSPLPSNSFGTAWETVRAQLASAIGISIASPINANRR
jgi:hypothetical protein